MLVLDAEAGEDYLHTVPERLHVEVVVQDLENLGLFLGDLGDR